MARAAAPSRLLTISKRLLSTTSITHLSCVPSPLFSHAVQSLPLATMCFTSVRCCSSYSISPLSMRSFLGDWSLSKSALESPGMDFKHWVVFMNLHEVGGATNQQETIDCFIKTLAKAVGSEEEAKKKIYKVYCNPRPKLRSWFGCEIDWETAMGLQDMPGVEMVRADSYADPINEDYGDELFPVQNISVEHLTERRSKRRSA